jgi:hypothetical protein
MPAQARQARTGQTAAAAAPLQADRGPEVPRLQQGQGLWAVTAGPPGREPVSQLSPYRRDRSVVGDDRTGTGPATGND